MQLRSLWLTDFRNYTQAELSLAPGLTAVVGAKVADAVLRYFATGA